MIECGGRRPGFARFSLLLLRLPARADQAGRNCRSKRAPCRERPLTAMLAPWALAISITIANPSPAPLVRTSLPRQKRSKVRPIIGWNARSVVQNTQHALPAHLDDHLGSRRRMRERVFDQIAQRIGQPVRNRRLVEATVDQRCPGARVYRRQRPTKLQVRARRCTDDWCPLLCVVGSALRRALKTASSRLNRACSMLLPSRALRCAPRSMSGMRFTNEVCELALRIVRCLQPIDRVLDGLLRNDQGR